MRLENGTVLSCKRLPREKWPLKELPETIVVVTQEPPEEPEEGAQVDPPAEETGSVASDTDSAAFRALSLELDEKRWLREEKKAEREAQERREIRQAQKEAAERQAELKKAEFEFKKAQAEQETKRLEVEQAKESQIVAGVLLFYYILHLAR